MNEGTCRRGKQTKIWAKETTWFLLQTAGRSKIAKVKRRIWEKEEWPIKSSSN